MKLYWLRFYFLLLFCFLARMVVDKKGVKFSLCRRKPMLFVILNLKRLFGKNSTSNKISFSANNFCEKNGGEIFLAQEKMHISFVILNLKRLFANNSTSNKSSFSAKGSVKRQLQRNSGKTNKARTNI